MIDRARYHFCLGILSVMLLSLASLARAEGIDAFFDDFTATWVRGDPNLATASRYFSGVEQQRLESQLTPETRAYQLQRIQLARQGLKELQKFDTSKLNDTQRLSAALMQWLLNAVVNQEPYLAYYFPLNQFGGANVRLVETLTLRHPLASQRDVENYLTRLALVPARMNEVVADATQLATKKLIPPRFILQATLDSMRAFCETAPERNPLVVVLEQKLATLDSIAPAARSQSQQKAVTLVATQVYPAWQREIGRAHV